MASLLERAKQAAKSAASTVKSAGTTAVQKAKTSLKSLMDAEDTGFQSKTSTRSIVDLPNPVKAPPSNKAMVFEVGAGMKPEEKKKAESVVKKQVESQKKQEAFVKEEKRIIPQPVKNFAKSVAPKTYENLATLRSKDTTPEQKITAALETPFRAPQEVILQPAARTFRGLTEPIAYGGRAENVPTYQPKSWLAKQLYGEAPVESLYEKTVKPAEMAAEFARNLPQVKSLPEGSFGLSGIPMFAGVLAAGAGGGLEGTNLDLGIGGAAKKGAEKLLKEGGERLVKEGAERLTKEGTERLAKDASQSIASAADEKLLDEGLTVFHTTNAINKDAILREGFKPGSSLPEDAFRGGGYGQMQDSISFSETPNNAIRFGISQNNTLFEAKLKPDAKIVDRPKVEFAEDLNAEIPSLREQGIDAVRIGSGEDEIVVINPKAIDRVIKSTDFRGTEAANLRKTYKIGPVGNEVYGAAVGIQPEFDEQGNMTGVGYDPRMGAIGVAGLSVSRTKVGRDILSSLNKQKTKYLDHFLSNTEEGLRLMDDFEASKASRDAVVDRVKTYIEPKNLASAIKNTPVYRKEGTAADWMREAQIMSKDGKYRLASRDDAKRLAGQGYSTVGYMDEITSGLGYDDGEKFIKDFVSHYENKPASNIRSYADQYLRSKDQNYAYLADRAEQAKLGKVSEEDFIPAMPPEEAGPSRSDLTRAFDAPNAKERKFITSVKESPTTAPEVKASVESVYEPIKNRETLKQAQTIIDQNPDKALEMVMNKAEKPTALKFAMAEDLIRRAQNIGDHQRAVDIVESVAEQATTAGQAIQALSMWSRLSPDGALAYAQRLINRANAERGTKLVLDPKEAGDIADIARRLQRVKAGEGQVQMDIVTGTQKRLNDLMKRVTEIKQSPDDEQMRLIPELFREVQGINDIFSKIDQSILPEQTQLELDPLKKRLQVLSDDLNKYVGGTGKQAPLDGLAAPDVLDQQLKGVPERLPYEAPAGPQSALDGLDILDKELKDIVGQIDSLQTGLGKQLDLLGEELTNKLLNKIADQVPPTFWQKVAGLRRISMLLNPKTFVRNVIGNTLFSGAENVADVLGTAIDLPISLITGKRTKTLPSLSAQAKGFKEGLKIGMREVEQNAPALSKEAADKVQQRIFKGPVLGRLEKAMNLSLKVPDRAAYEAAFRGRLDQLMRIAKTTEPTDEMLEVAHLSALYRTFQDKTYVGNLLSGLKKSLNGKKEFGFGDFLIAFSQTPGSIAQKATVDYTPLGFIKAAFELVSPLTGGKLSNKTFNQDAFVSSLSRATIGTGVIMLGAYLAKLGVLSGQAAENRNIDSLQSQEGKGRYKMNVSALKRLVLSGFNPDEAKERAGDTMFSYDWAQPLSSTLSIGASYGKKDGWGVLDAALGSTEALTDQSVFSGIRSFTNQLAYGAGIGGAVMNTLKDIPSSFIPSAINQFRQLADNVSRETYDPRYYGAAEALKRAQNRIPFLAEHGIPGTPVKGLPPRSNLVGGDKETYQDSSNTLFNVLLNPGFVSTLKQTPEVKELLDLYERTGETKQTPDQVKKNETVNGVSYQLSSEDYAKANQYIGVRSKAEINRIITNPAYAKLPDDKKINELSKVLNQVSREAKAPSYFKAIGVQVPKWLIPQVQAKLIQEASKSKTFKQAKTPEAQKALWSVYLTKLEKKVRETGKVPGIPKVKPVSKANIGGSLVVARRNPSKVIAGYDFTTYATDPRWGTSVRTHLTRMPEFRTVDDITRYIRKQAPRSPLTGEMVVASAQRFGVEPRIILAIAKQEANFATLGRAAWTHNPGNVGNVDSGANVNWGSWEKGMDALARNVARRRIA